MNPPELLVVLPVYNEEASLPRVVGEWVEEISRWTLGFKILAINDGSTDGTGEVLRDLASKSGDRIEVLTQANGGHGQTCLRGYRIACEAKVPWLLQIDSDGQCDPEYFGSLWEMRENFDVIYGRRVVRKDGCQRALAALVFKAGLLLIGGTYCADANTPYRLIRVSAMCPLLNKIPPRFFMVNSALAVLMKRQGDLRHGMVPIRFRARFAGESTIPPRILVKKAVEFFRELRRL